jgi:hypothetical protein
MSFADNHNSSAYTRYAEAEADAGLRKVEAEQPETLATAE